MSGLAAIQVPKVIRMCARAFGIEISDIPSPRSIGRFVLEGGAAAKVQVGDIIAQAHGMHTLLYLNWIPYISQSRCYNEHGLNLTT